MFAKINVEGENVSPLWEYLSKSGKISGNWTKFLIDEKGNVIDRYGPWVTVELIEPNIHKHFNFHFNKKVSKVFGDIL